MIHSPLVGVVAALVKAGGSDEIVQRLLARYPAEALGCDCGGCRTWNRIVGIMGLSPLEATVLAVAVAPDLDPDLARYLDGMAEVRGDRPSLELACSLAGGDLDDVHLLAHPAGALVRHGLLTVIGTGPLPLREVAAPQQLSSALCVDGLVDPLVEVMRVRVRAADVHGAEALAGAIEAGESLCYVHATGDSPGRSMVAAALERVGVDCLAVDPHRLPDRGQLGSALRAAVLESAIRGAVLLVEGIDDLGGESVAALSFLQSCAVPVVAIGRSPWQPHWLIDAPPVFLAPGLRSVERRGLWAASTGPGEHTNALSQIRLTPEEISHSAEMAASSAHYAGTDLVAALLPAARASVPADAVLKERAVTATFEDLILSREVMDSVVQLVGWARMRERLFMNRQVLGKASRGTGLLALFTGPPGTGKTLSAEVVAAELGLPLQVVTLTEVVDKYIGETERNLEKVFAQAERSSGVLLFDEADALFGARTATKDSKDRYANQEIAYLLQRMEAFDGVAILASNLPGNLDAAFHRRLHFIVHFALPDVLTKKRLWQSHLAALGDLDQSDPVDLDLLSAIPDIAGGDIRNIALAAAFGAALADDPAVGHRHLVAAWHREMQKLGRRT